MGMIGGMTRTSAFALFAAASLAMSGWSLQAKAADLGGNCCADLEERVADLEATTARKGNRKVSLEISGQVNRAIVGWNDGKASDAYIVDNEQSNTRFRMKGTGQFADGWKSGFYIELGVNDTNSAQVSQWDDEGRAGAGEDFSQVNVRQANVFIESAKYGRVTIGQGSGATDDLGYINLGGSLSDAGQYYNNSFWLRGNGGTNTGIKWGTIVGSTNLFDSNRGDYVRYDTPSLYGFILSAAWGENDVWDLALRYQKEWNSFRVAAGIGYYYNGDQQDYRGLPNAQVTDGTKFGSVKREKIVGSASVMHVPTGLYVSGAAVTVNTTDAGAKGQGEIESSAWYIQGGITKRFVEVGATTVYGEFANYDNIGAGYKVDGATATNLPAGSTATYTAGYIASSNVDRWGAGVTQAFDGAALELYLQYHHYSADVSVSAAANLVRGETVKVEDWDAVVTGLKLKF
jgi:hypothetical protein